MPRVPVYDAPTVQPESLQAPMQGTPANLDAASRLNQAQGRQISQGLMQAGRVMDMMQIEQDETDATRAHADYIAATTRILHGSVDDPQNPGILQRPGQQAIDAEPDAAKALEDARSQIRDSLKTQRAQQLFSKAAAVTYNSATGQIASHVGAAQAQADIDADKRRVDTAGNAAVLAFNPMPGADNSAYQTYLATREASLRSLAQRQGVRTDQLDQFVKDGMSPTYAGVVAHLVDNKQAAAAREYFKANADKITDADVRDKLTKAIDNASDTDDALRIALGLKGSLTAKTAELNRQFKDGTITAKVRDQALQYVEHDHQVAKSQEQEYVLGVMGKAQKWLMDNPTKSVLEMPEGWRNTLQAKGHLDSILSFARNGRFVNDPQTWAEIATMSPQDLAKMTPKEFELAYRGKLDDQHLNQGIAAVKAARNMPLEGETLELVTNGEYVKRKAQQSGILPVTGTPSGDQTSQFQNFETEVQRRLDQLSRELGGTRKPTRKELESIVDQTLTDKVFVSEWGRDPQKPLSALTPDEQGKAYVTVGKEEIRLTDIPASQRTLIEQSLRRRNIPVTEQLVANLWVQGGKKQ